MISDILIYYVKTCLLNIFLVDRHLIKTNINKVGIVREWITIEYVLVASEKK